jgi:hypothetical protein
MTDHDLDARLTALLAEPAPPPDPAFTDRIVALARHDLAGRRARRRVIERVGIETLALAAVVVAFASLARTVPQGAGFGDVVGLASPAMLGLAMLGLWALVGIRAVPADR